MSESGKIQSADDVRAWIVEDDEAEDELEGILLCPDCVTSYIGDGEPHPVAHEDFQANVPCHECGEFLGPDYTDESDAREP